ncbi:sensor histidine kinase [Streptomyces yaizuensis]|uniref:histidine kinase n=1 Tax=Streptomyces yaizuensis TaxID=2989713 RepID=A0ABQ5P7R9_9ACTN|nr:HAMP domain-containing sensor histidine kinase [Streptomyces sp. YSPA8]GLF98641.1 HAMP domain-containing histidine kinase [Streptomyces sp. YSPA8]
MSAAAQHPAGVLTPGDPAAGPLLVWRRRRLTARWRLTLSYAFFTLVAGSASLAMIITAMRFIPNYPLTASNPRDRPVAPTRNQIMDALIEASGYALILLGIVGLTAGYVIAGRVLRPLQSITAAAHQAATGALDHRIGLTGRRDEFTDLSDAFDHMLDRLQEAFEMQQRFAANASHELRTPLSITRAMLDVARADPEGQDWDRLTTRLDETNQRGIEIVEALLQLSSLSHEPLRPRPLELAGVAGEALELVREEAADRGVAVTAELGETWVTGHDVLLRQVAVNLLQNAIRHNLPSGGSLTLTTGTDPAGGALLTVRNTGPVLSAAAVATFTEPFLRGQGRTTTAGRRGHGLGLSIAAAITGRHGGALTLAPGAAGGLTASLRLPSAPG